VGNNTVFVTIPSNYNVSDLQVIYSYTLYNVATPGGIAFASGGMGVTWGTLNGQLFVTLPNAFPSGSPVSGTYLRLVVPHNPGLRSSHQARLSQQAHQALPAHNDCTYRAKNGYATNDLQFFNGDAQWM